MNIQEPGPGPSRRTPWYDMLTLDHTLCRICHADGVQTRMITDPAVIAMRSRPHTRAAYTARQKAALRAHIAEAHPDWTDRVIWRKAPVR